MARKHLLPLLPRFLAAHPLIELELSSTDRYVDVIVKASTASYGPGLWATAG